MVGKTMVVVHFDWLVPVVASNDPQMWHLKTMGTAFTQDPQQLTVHNKRALPGNVCAPTLARLPSPPSMHIDVDSKWRQWLFIH